jgi:Methyltransferase domain
MLSLAKKGGKICEMGVLKGDFAEIILGLCDPKEFVLVDIWPEEVVSGNVNGMCLETFNGEDLYKYVAERFSKEESVEILRQLTTKALKKFPDNYFDMIYIDADHTYKAVVKDLKWAHKKIKNGGFIMGHDYEMNPNKTTESYEFGVKRAVDEFCIKHKQQISAKGMDGCVSYAIKVKKS